MTIIAPNSTVLFQGDSITDCGRSREDDSYPGLGYVYQIAAEFGRRYPRHNVRFLNRGVSGDRVVNLEQRWDADCLALKPDWVSIYIGVNDTWRRYDSNDPTSAEAYYEGYRRLILRTRESLDAGLVLIEPFLLPTPNIQPHWREDLDPKIHAVRALAREFSALYIPLDGLFAAASTQTDSAYWAPDGVHPSPAGHALIAQAWLSAVHA